MKLLIVYYSRYGHVYRLARAVEEGARAVEGIEPVLRRVDEFAEFKNWDKDERAGKFYREHQDVPVCTIEDLDQADGICFGSPTRYGNVTAQLKLLIDKTAQLWLKGRLEGKPAGMFTSTATTHGGQETTLMTLAVPLLHLGMVVCGIPYSNRQLLHTEGRGGTPYGASTIAGSNGELEPAPEDLELARILGKRVAEVTKKLRG